MACYQVPETIPVRTACMDAGTCPFPNLAYFEASYSTNDPCRVTCEACRNTKLFREAARSQLPAIGTSILRGASYHGHTATVDTWEPTKNDRGQYFFRAGSCGGFTEDPYQLSVREPAFRGLACFCRAKILHPWWTHFEVVGHTKRGTGVFVEPVYGDFNELAKQLTAVHLSDGKWERVVLPASFALKPSNSDSLGPSEKNGH